MMTTLLILALALVAGLFCFILVEIDRRIRMWFNYGVIYRQNMGEINGADIIRSLKEKEGKK